MNSGMNFTEWSREEKDEFAKKRMNEMKLLNEKFMQRHAEVERDRIIAERKNSSITSSTKVSARKDKNSSSRAEAAAGYKQSGKKDHEPKRTHDWECDEAKKKNESDWDAAPKTYDKEWDEQKKVFESDWDGPQKTYEREWDIGKEKSEYWSYEYDRPNRRGRFEDRKVERNEDNWRIGKTHDNRGLEPVSGRKFNTGSGSYRQYDSDRQGRSSHFESAVSSRRFRQRGNRPNTVTYRQFQKSFSDEQPKRSNYVKSSTFRKQHGYGTANSPGNSDHEHEIVDNCSKVIDSSEKCTSSLWQDDEISEVQQKQSRVEKWIRSITYSGTSDDSDKVPKYSQASHKESESYHTKYQKYDRPRKQSWGNEELNTKVKSNTSTKTFTSKNNKYDGQKVYFSQGTYRNQSAGRETFNTSMPLNSRRRGNHRQKNFNESGRWHLGAQRDSNQNNYTRSFGAKSDAKDEGYNYGDRGKEKFSKSVSQDMPVINDDDTWYGIEQEDFRASKKKCSEEFITSNNTGKAVSPDVLLLYDDDSWYGIEQEDFRSPKKKFSEEFITSNNTGACDVDNFTSGSSQSKKLNKKVYDDAWGDVDQSSQNKKNNDDAWGDIDQSSQIKKTLDDPWGDVDQSSQNKKTLDDADQSDIAVSWSGIEGNKEYVNADAKTSFVERKLNAQISDMVEQQPVLTSVDKPDQVSEINSDLTAVHYRDENESISKIDNDDKEKINSTNIATTDNCNRGEDANFSVVYLEEESSLSQIESQITVRPAELNLIENKMKSGNLEECQSENDNCFSNNLGIVIISETIKQGISSDVDISKNLSNSDVKVCSSPAEMEKDFYMDPIESEISKSEVPSHAVFNSGILCSPSSYEIDNNCVPVSQQNTQTCYTNLLPNDLATELNFRIGEANKTSPNESAIIDLKADGLQKTDEHSVVMTDVNKLPVVATSDSAKLHEGLNVLPSSAGIGIDEKTDQPSSFLQKEMTSADVANEVSIKNKEEKTTSADISEPVPINNKEEISSVVLSSRNLPSTSSIGTAENKESLHCCSESHTLELSLVHISGDSLQSALNVSDDDDGWSTVSEDSDNVVRGLPVLNNEKNTIDSKGDAQNNE